VGRKKRRSALGTLNLISWSIAALVWGIVVIKRDPPATQSEPRSDPLHVTGSRKAPPKSSPEESSFRQPHPSEQPVIALVVDDFGPAWDQQLVDGFVNLPFEITISIIPGNRTSIKVAKEATRAGKEVFIHLPLEPEERIAMDERDMLMVGTSNEQVRVILDRVVREIPEATGINNHMGSKATTNRRLMESLAQVVHKKDLCFVDSRTSERSAALRAMIQAGVPALGRDVFLDVLSDSASVAKQIHELAFIAKQRGWAIGIGHVKHNTLAAVSAIFPSLEAEGFRFLGAGELIDELSGELDSNIASGE